MTGVFAFMLHAHIPYCKKSGVWPAGEEWLFEAMNETYIPLLKALRSLRSDGIVPRVMLSFVPVLMEQLADEYMKDRFCEYMEDKIGRARSDRERFRSDPARRAVASYWLDVFEDNYRTYTRDFYRDILGTCKWLQEEGVIEVLTSAATHGFLPLLEQDSADLQPGSPGHPYLREIFRKEASRLLASGMRVPARRMVSQGTLHAQKHRPVACRRRDRVFLRGRCRHPGCRLCGKPAPGGQTDHHAGIPPSFGRVGIREERGIRANRSGLRR
jgi:hypothetical protein